MCFHSGSLGRSVELKGASTVVVKEPRIFGAQNFPSSLKQHNTLLDSVIMFPPYDR